MPEMQDAANFIPNGGGTVTPPPEPGSESKGGLADVLLLVAIVLLAASLAIATGVFLYGRLVDKQLAEGKKTLDIASSRVSPHTVEELQSLSKRLTAGNDLLSKHIAPSEIFKALELITLKSVQFTEFKFSYTSPELMQLSLKGKALTVNAVAAQSKAFSANQDKFQNTIFSNLGFEKDGTVSFQVTTDINPDFINFVGLVLKNTNEGVGANNQQAAAAASDALNANDSSAVSSDTQSASQSDNAQVPSGQQEGVQTDEFGNVIN